MKLYVWQVEYKDNGMYYKSFVIGSNAANALYEWQVQTVRTESAEVIGLERWCEVRKCS